MGMNLRRSALSLLATTALLGGLTACGGGDDEPAAAEQASGTAATGTTDAAGGDDGGVDAMAGNNAPGTGADAYDPNDPFVGNKSVKAPPLTVVTASFAFTPKKITVKPGEQWTLDNQDIATHNIETRGKNPGKIKSPDALPGKKATFKMPTKKGTYKTVCFYHQAMELDIVVK
jgi:plastocyanin